MQSYGSSHVVIEFGYALYLYLLSVKTMCLFPSLRAGFPFSVYMLREIASQLGIDQFSETASFIKTKLLL